MLHHAVCRHYPHALCLTLLLALLAAPAMAQDDTDASAATVGSILFEPLPEHLDNIGDAGFFWRIPALPHAQGGAMPLEQLHVVLIHDTRARPSQDVDVDIEGYRILPRTLVAAPGTALTFHNKGRDASRLHVVGRSGIDPLELAKTGDEASVTLEKPGRYLFRDTDYTSILTYVIVTSSVADSALTGVTHAEARFDLGVVPAGSYKLRIYYQGGVILEEEVKISRDGRLSKDKFLLTRKELQGAAR